jgi:hypothetical protein
MLSKLLRQADIYLTLGLIFAGLFVLAGLVFVALMLALIFYPLLRYLFGPPHPPFRDDDFRHIGTIG